jgi:hypothetical protein
MATLEALEVAITLGHLNQNEATGQYFKIIEGTSWHTSPGGLTALHQMRRGLYDDQRSRGGGSMAPITRIEVRLITSNHAGAGTIGPVYVGVCRREFGINNSDLDFTPGHDFTYVFGEGPTSLMRPTTTHAPYCRWSRTTRRSFRGTYAKNPRMRGISRRLGSPSTPANRARW